MAHLEKAGRRADRRDARALSRHQRELLEEARTGRDHAGAAGRRTLRSVPPRIRAGGLPRGIFEGVLFRARLGREILRGGGGVREGAQNKGHIFLVTNGAQYTQTRRIAASGLGAYADGAFISEAIGINKPSKEYAAYVEAHIGGYERSRAVWVGDSLTSDAPCAASLGIDFILYRPEGAPEGYKGLCAKSYDEALELIGKM